MKSEYLPYGTQTIEQDDIDAVSAVLRSDYLTCGPAVDEFEKALAAKVGAKYAVAVANGTAALHIAYAAAGLCRGDDFVTTPLTFAATANAGLFLGANAVFTDIESDTGNMDIAELESRITERTRLIAPVHYGGQPVDLLGLRRIAKKYNIKVVEDACHALGASFDGAPVGSCQYSDMTVFSFHPVKHITTGEGGAVTVNDEELYSKLKLLRTHGITASEKLWDKQMSLLGYNYRLTDIQAALGTSQLKKLERFVERRREIAAAYDKAFADSALLRPTKTRRGRVHSYHIYTLLLDSSINRDSFITGAHKKGVGLQVHYGPVHKHPYYQEHGYGIVNMPAAEDFAARVVSIPIYPKLTNSDIEYVARNLENIAGQR